MRALDIRESKNELNDKLKTTVSEIDYLAMVYSRLISPRWVNVKKERRCWYCTNTIHEGELALSATASKISKNTRIPKYIYDMSVKIKL